MMAMSTEHSSKLNKMDNEMAMLKTQNEHTVSDVTAQLEASNLSVKESNERLSGVECERDSLKEALSSQKSATDQESAAQISALKGEVELLKERFKNAEFKTAAFGEKSADDVRELEEQLSKMKLERRKMFNVIQELRGNVRVFARVRPFLPNDNAAPDQVSVVQVSRATWL